jgi:hypothetical protein
MFIGHYALAFASRKISPLPSLAIMFIAVEFLDFIWPIFVLLGIESFQIEPGITKLTPLNFTYYPYSHSLLMSILWSILFGTCYFLFTKNKQESLLLCGLVFSHWILDFLVHRPDLPLTPFSDFKVGLGLWNHPAFEIILEVGMFVIGIYLYYTSANPKRKISFWLLIGFFLISYLSNLLGPPPPKPEAVAWTANLMWLFVIWGWWIEKPLQKGV